MSSYKKNGETAVNTSNDIVIEESKQENTDEDLLLSTSEDLQPNILVPEDLSDSGSHEKDSDSEDDEAEEAKETNQFAGKSLYLKPEEDINNAPVFKRDLEIIEEKMCKKNRNDNIIEEVELMKAAAEEPEQLYFLIATDPEYYIGIIEHYKEEVVEKYKDNKNDTEEKENVVVKDLQSLFNLKVNRDDGKLRLKFKLYPEDKWVECGFFNNSGDDEETYEEFIKHVEVEINRPRKPRPKNGEKLTIDQVLDQGGNRDHLNYELGAENNIQNDNYKNTTDDEIQRCDKPSIGDIVKDRNKTTVESLQNVLRNNPELRNNRELKRSQHEEHNNVSHRENKRSNLHFSLVDKSETSGSYLNRSGDPLLRAYLNQILSKIASNIPIWLDLNKVYGLESYDPEIPAEKYAETLTILESQYDDCPVFLKKDYLNFMNKMKNPLNPRFLKTLGKIQEVIPDEFLPDYYTLMSKCSSSIKINDRIYQQLFEPDFSHDNICRLLNLSDNDLSLFDNYKINLLEEWNNYVGNFNSYLRN